VVHVRLFPFVLAPKTRKCTPIKMLASVIRNDALANKFDVPFSCEEHSNPTTLTKRHYTTTACNPSFGVLFSQRLKLCVKN